MLEKRKIIHIIGRGFTLLGSDMDTDRIIPARFLKCVTFEGLGDHVFEDDRHQLAGAHPFDLPSNKGANILLAGENFASGSSREHAVPALTQWGIKAIIALSFAAIFRGNATGNGLVCVTVDPETHALINGEIEAGADEITVDLVAKSILIKGEGSTSNFKCDIPDYDRDVLTEGNWDEMAVCLEAGPLIEETAARVPFYITQPETVSAAA